jgi:hypothetical protein
MGLMDKVKAQATQLAQKTQETAREGKARLDQVQANKHADVLLRNLGALVFAEQTGRGTAESPDHIARLIAEISAHEAENGINLSAQQAGWVPPQSGSGGPGGPGTMGGPGSTPFAGPPASTFPQSGPAFPDAAPTTTFPDAGTTFPESSDPTSFPQSGGPTPSPESSDPTSFPPPDPGSQPGH